MRRLFLILAVFSLLCLYLTADRKGSVAAYYQGWSLDGKYTPTDEEMGIQDEAFYTPRDSSEVW